MSAKRKLFFVLAALLAFSVLSNALIAAPPSAEASLLARLEAQSGGAVQVHRYDVTGVARYIEPVKGSYLTDEFAGQGDAEAIARAFLGGYGSFFGLTDQAAELSLKSVKKDALGQEHVRFAQRHGGVEVFGADLVVHLQGGAVLAANGYTVPGLSDLSTQVTLKQEEAAKVAARELAFTKDAFVGESSLVILKPALITEQPSGTFLTYRMKVDSASRPELAKWVFVDAQTGDLRFSYPAVYDARNRNTYNMKRGTSYTSAVLARSETTAPVSSATNCTAADVNNAHDYAGDTYNFYYNRFGRDSYNNAGAALNSYVCYGSNYQNAFWDGSKMTYGDGFAAADDVVSHELSHAVTEYASGLIYSYQSGALNESFSDIFGEAVDLTNAKGTDTSTVRWDMGEDIPGIGAIRDMMDPPRFSDPDRTTSSYYHCSSGDNGGVHINSGVPNKAFALMVDGGSFNGKSVVAIGMDKAVQIQYRTNEVYLTGSSKFLDNYNYLIRSCSDLVGQHGITTTDCANMRVALDAVVMNGAICGSGGATPTPGGTSPTATPAPAPTATPVPGGGSITNGTFESGRNVGWGEYSAKGYALVSSGSAYQGSWKAWLAGANSETSEISQNITVPSSGNTLYYRYKITSSDSCGYDYGYVKINNTNVKTYNLCSTSATSSYVQGSVSLSGYAGQTVTLKFRATTDSSYSSSFYIDNVGYSASFTGLSDEAEPAGVYDAIKPGAKPTGKEIAER